MLNPPVGRPRAVLVIVLDGMRLDYFDRHRSALPTLDRLRNEGGWFSRARVNFLPTVTALRKKAGRNGFIVVITPDHGMPPEPAGPRKRYFDVDVVKLLHQKFDPDRGALVQHYEAWNSELFIDPDRLRELRLTTSDIKAYLEAQPFIYAAFTEDEVKRAASR